DFDWIADTVVMGEQTMAQLVQLCKPVTPGTTGAALCVAYFRGFLDRQILVQLANESRLHKMCLPDGITTEQAIKVFLKWADAHPAELHEPAAFHLGRSLIAAFPCNK